MPLILAEQHHDVLVNSFFSHADEAVLSRRYNLVLINQFNFSNGFENVSTVS